MTKQYNFFNGRREVSLNMSQAISTLHYTEGGFCTKDTMTATSSSLPPE